MKKLLLNDLRKKIILLSQKNKIDNIERLYYPYIIDNICYLYGATVIYNKEDNNIIFIRDIYFGYDAKETRNEAEQKGYKFINYSGFINDNLDVLDHKYCKVRKKNY